MQAVAVMEFGGTPSLLELPRPEPGPHEVLVRLAAAGVNPMDQAVADGQFEGRLPHTFPLVLGFDGAGEVAATGGAVTRFAVGDEVYGQFFHPPLGRSGSYAEYAVVPQRMDNGAIGRAPRGLPPGRAAAAPTAAMTAIGLLDEVGLRAGQTVLIVGASGGVGCFATQLAAAVGARVIATARGDAAEQLRALGAAQTVDYAAAPLDEQVRAAHLGGVDVLLDLVSNGGSGAFEANASLVRDGGTAASIVFAASRAALDGRRVRAFDYLLRDKATLLDRLTADLDAGRLRVPVEAEVPLRDAPALLARRRRGGARGKTVVRA
ncbi:MAG TPA: NADP-dependent oxidoreductase [Actinomycetes bacterium]